MIEKYYIAMVGSHIGTTRCVRCGKRYDHHYGGYDEPVWCDKKGSLTFILPGSVNYYLKLCK